MKQKVSKLLSLILAVVLTAGLALSLAGCGGQSSSNAPSLEDFVVGTWGYSSSSDNSYFDDYYFGTRLRSIEIRFDADGLFYERGHYNNTGMDSPSYAIDDWAQIGTYVVDGNNITFSLQRKGGSILFRGDKSTEYGSLNPTSGELQISTQYEYGNNMGKTAYVYFTKTQVNSGSISSTADGSSLTADEQYAVNIFLSNFSEQNAFANGFDIDYLNLEELVDFAYLYRKINSWKSIGLERVNEESYYTITLDTVNDTLHRFFGIILTDTETKSVFSQVPWSMPSDGRSKTYYMSERFYFPAADGESYNRLTIVKRAEPLGDGTLRLHFDIYSLDIEEYFNDGTVNSSYYYLTAEKAAQHKHLAKTDSGVAIVKPYEYNGRQTYQLISYNIGSSAY